LKYNSIFLLTAVGVFAIFSLLTMSTTTNFSAVAQSNETENNPTFYANLTSEALPFSVSNAEGTGNASLTLKDGANTMYYVISGNDVGNITATTIAQNTGGRSTDLVLLSYAPASGLITKGSGTAEGNFTSANFTNVLQGVEMSELVKRILDGNVYVVVKTVDFPLGEIGGKLQPMQ
jgi:hypothetical protein